MLIVALALLAVGSTASKQPEGVHTATAGRAAAPLAPAPADPDGRPAATPRKPHVILLILDELPSDSMRGPDGGIDALRYPNLAGLARNATWFPNAFTSYDSTEKAVPLIMDGRRARPGLPPDRKGHPRSIFDMFGRQGYRIHESQEATALCPRRWCPRARQTKPPVVANLNRGRRERYDRFVASLAPSSRPTFWLKHVLLPHGPYMFLPSGAQTRSGPRDPVPKMNGVPGFGDAFLTLHNEQRYLLQLGFVDRQIGQMIDRLVRQGMYDDTMIAVVADHGFDFTVGVKDRRKLSSRNIQQVGPVPLFVKAAGQRRGRVDPAYASTLDVTPTIADVLNFRLPYRADGHSAFSRAVRRRRTISAHTRDFSRVVRISAREYERRRRAVMRRRLRDFGSGLTGLYSGIGPNRDLVGRTVGGLRTAAAGQLRGGLVAARAYAGVRRSSRLVPAQVAGRLRGGRRRARHDLAVAVNGRIEAVGRSFYLAGDRQEYFAMMVPEETLRDGRNEVVVYEVGRGRLLRPVARS